MNPGHPRCPVCNGLLKHKPADILGPECVKCILCSWEYSRPIQPFTRPDPPPKQTPPDWVSKAIEIKTIVLIENYKSAPRREQMGSQLVDLNDKLFSQLDRLSDDKITGDKLKEEIERSRAVTNVAREIIDNARLALDAHRTVGQAQKVPAMLGIGQSE